MLANIQTLFITIIIIVSFYFYFIFGPVVVAFKLLAG